MTKVTVELLSDTVTEIVVQNLSEALSGLIQDYKNRATNAGSAIFDHDPEMDRIEIQRHIDALHLVLGYYVKY